MLELPASAQLLAASATAPNEVWTVGDRLLAIQGHPEMDPKEALAKIHATLASNGCAAPNEACVIGLYRAVLGSWSLVIVRCPEHLLTQHWQGDRQNAEGTARVVIHSDVQGATNVEFGANPITGPDK